MHDAMDGSGKPLTALAQDAADDFQRQFNRPPRWVVAAPGRVNIIGEHVDYNDGFVLPMAIERYAVIAADHAVDTADRVALYSAELDVRAAFDLTPPLSPADPHWTNYVRGVIAGFQERDIQVAGFDAVIDSNVPIGGGLSSSAALEVATATLIEAMTGRVLSTIDKALLCQKAEHIFAGTPCGIMDQYASIHGRADQLLLLDCRSLETRYVPLADPGVTVLIINSNVQHELARGEGGLSPYAERRMQCEQAAAALGVASLREATMPQLDGASLDPLIHRRARHVITEIARTLDAADAIAARDWSEAGRLMLASHASLRDDFEVSTPELDLLVELAQTIGETGGVYGSRMTGGGFGGCTVSLVRTNAVHRVAQTIAEQYQSRTGTAPTTFITRPAPGAGVLQTV